MKKYNFLNTMRKCLLEVWKAGKGIYLLMFVYTIFATLLPIAGIFMPRLIIEELQKTNIQFEQILVTIGILTVLIGIFSFFERFITDYVVVKVMGVRIGLLTGIFDKMNRLDYHYTENPQFLNEHNEAFDVIGGNTFEEVFMRLFRMSSKVLLAGIYIYFLVNLTPFVVLGIITSVIVGIIISLIIKEVQFKKRKDIQSAHRRIRYFEQTMTDFSYGKDIRLYNYQDKIKENYDFEIMSYVKVFKKIRNKEYFLGFLELFFVLISDAVLYYFLITKVFDNLSLAMFSFYLLIALALSTLLKEFVEDVVYLIAQGQHLNGFFFTL